MKSWMVFTLFLLACCLPSGATSEAVAREGLNILADTVGPASKLASLSCEAQKRLVPAEIKAGLYSTAVGDPKLQSIRARCSLLEETFDTIRALQAEAAQAVESGRVQEALLRIDQAGQHFRGVQPMLEGP